MSSSQKSVNNGYASRDVEESQAQARQKEVFVYKDELSFIKRVIQSVFGFRKTSLTLFVLLTYFLVLILNYWAKGNALSLPSKEPHVLTTSWLDLQRISQKPHPYISHANDEVHDYILARVKALAAKNKFITVSDDQNSDISLFKLKESIWNATNKHSSLHYYESSNVLVKIDGQDLTLDGLLLSAHYDSVPTAYGTTDDGAGIASLLGVLENYVTSGERPLRTIVFNFNNNEEFGLFGADAFFNHPWSKLVKYFINLEGTGTGERAILFRTTDYSIGKFYQSARSPFATSIFQQGFANDLVHSETDYRVYADNGLRGLDIAFYKPRSLYHTSSDSIRHSSKNALWHMLSNTLDVTKAIANAKYINDDESIKSVFFDVLGKLFIILPSKSVEFFNIVSLLVVPVILIFFGVIIKKREIWFIGYSWMRLPFSLVISGAASKIVLEVIYITNPFIISSDFISPLVASAGTFLFFNYAILTVTQSLWPIHDLKLLITLEVFIGLWVILLISTVKQSNSTAITGEYFYTISYGLYSISAILGLFSTAVFSPKRKKATKFTNYNSINEQTQNDSQNEQTADENVPLLSNHITDDNTEEEETEELLEEALDRGHSEHNLFSYDWSLQFLILVPVNFLLAYVSTELILEALNQTSQEGSSGERLVFYLILLASFATTIPLLSFAYKLNFLFAILLIFSIVFASFKSIFGAPFTESQPIKFRFSQIVNLNDVIPKTYAEVFGRAGFLPHVLKDLPSMKASDESITCTSSSDGNELCSYFAERPYLVEGKSDYNDLFSYLTVKFKKSDENANPSPYAPLTAEIEINAKDNRFCFISFNSTAYKFGHHGKSPVKIITVFHDKSANKSSHDNFNINIPSDPSKDADGNDVFKWFDGIDDVHLHKLDWNQQSYHLGLRWIPKWLDDGEEQEPIDSPNNKLGISVSCYWGEYDDVAIIDGKPKRKVPAFDEILQYSPLTTSFSNRYEGLVRIDRYIEI